ncbi:DNA-directed RNA polymerase III subunit RPC7 [Sitodiplosis mosellana]|uniref:DNA-directed RNA polymerase III subunit RPC7 n=1 Tax=Sitodiplosis mosellana TaxID=263140 RepID=UPI0024440BFC|nr:DNA-directed RNA polymerase III subunit RPC7 [Sitodiplosis mosellana]
MAGRGGFKGASSSLRPEQLQGMGIVGKDMPSATVAPPPTFPQLLSRPALLEKNSERDFMIDWKENFLSYLKNSPYYTGSTEESKHIHSRYFLESSQVENGAFNWSMMPAELRPNWKRKLNTKDGSKKLAKDVNVEETLKALEQKEKTRKANGAPNDDDDKEDDEAIEDEEQDEEMDDENDYGNNYFDDGGNYLDEDDNLDDGPTY